MIYQSREISTEENLYRGVFRHKNDAYYIKGTGRQIIKDELITTFEVAKERARAELLKNGYKERWITINCKYIPNLKVNDIINFKNKNWIIKQITYSYTTPTLTLNIRGVRYE